jgi:hypothetical protein
VEPEERGGGFRIEISEIGGEKGEARIVIGGRIDEGYDEGWSGREDGRVSFGEDVWIEADEIIDGDVVIFNGDANVSGEIEGELVVIGGDIFIEGRVNSDVVAILGDIELTEDAVCEGDVVSVGGTVDQNGASIDGQALSVQLFPGTGASPHVKSALLAVVGISWIAFLVFALLVGGAFRLNAERMVEAVREERGRCLWVGVLGHILVHVASAVLLITIVGAPLAPVAWFLVWCASMVALIIGAAEAARGRGESQAVVKPALAAGTIIHLLLAAGIWFAASDGGALRGVGVVLSLLAGGVMLWFTMLGSGSLITTRFGARPGRGTPESPPAPLFEPRSPVEAS